VPCGWVREANKLFIYPMILFFLYICSCDFTKLKL